LKSLSLGQARITLKEGDLVNEDVDAIVNAANSSLLGGGGVDGAIHRAGGPAILEACKQIVARSGRLSPGKAMITVGGRLKAKYVIHTVGPVWQGGQSGEPETLASAYRESLVVASARGLESVSFPSISSGAYGYPVEQASGVAIGAVVSFLRHGGSSVKDVTFVLHDRRTYEMFALSLDRFSRQV
jgi:O-acetyl-ADP-ribose deacetylase (regulator of RNase III)